MHRARRLFLLFAQAQCAALHLRQDDVGPAGRVSLLRQPGGPAIRRPDHRLGHQESARIRQPATTPRNGTRSARISTAPICSRATRSIATLPGTGSIPSTGTFTAARRSFRPPPRRPADDGYHAYSHVNTLGGAGAAYLVTGEPRYLDILKNGYDYLQSHEMFATGGYGPDEQLLPRDKLIRQLYYTSPTFETQCGSWAAFKMVRYLMTFTGDARYGDWVESLLYNGIGASIP